MNTKKSITIRNGSYSFRNIKSEQKISSLNSFIKLLMMSNFKPNNDDCLLLVQYLFKCYSEEMSKFLNLRIPCKIPETYSKLARIVSFSYWEKDSIVINSKLKSADDILLITGDLEILNLNKQLKSISKSTFLDYLINLKSLKEDELVKRCLRLNAIGIDSNDIKSPTVNSVSSKTESTANCLIKSISVNEYIQSFQKPLLCEDSSSNTLNDGSNNNTEFIIYVYQKYQAISGMRKLELVQSLPEENDLRISHKESAEKFNPRRLSQQNKLKLKFLKQDLLKYNH